MASALCSSPHVEKLPYSCTWRIFEYLDVIALRETRVVSKFFKLFSDGDRVWSRHALPLIQKEGRSPATPNHGYRAIFYQKLKFWSLTTHSEGMVSKQHELETTGPLLNWGTAVVDYPRIRNKRQYCEFMIEDSRKGYLDSTNKIVIGLVPENFDVSVGHCIGEGQSYGYIAKDGSKIGGGGAEMQQYAQGYEQGDRIGVLADPIENVITFYKNGECLGPAFSNFIDSNTRSFQFAVSLVRSYMKVRILTDVSVPKQAYPAPSVKAITPSELPLNRCPRDILQVIFAKMSVNDVNDMRLVRKDWNLVASNDYLWRALALKLCPDLEALWEPSLTTCRLTLMRNVNRFSSIARAPGLELGDDRTSVTSTNEVTYWSAIRLDYPKMTSGVHYAEFQIDVFRHGTIGNTWKLVCGLVTDEFDYALTKWVGVDERSFGFIAASGKVVGPQCKNLGTTYADGYQENDRIGVLIDFPQDKIYFYKNGVNLGVAFDGFSKQVKLNHPENVHYYFAVSLARWGMKITCIPNARCPDRDVPISAY